MDSLFPCLGVRWRGAVFTVLLGISCGLFDQSGIASATVPKATSDPYTPWTSWTSCTLGVERRQRKCISKKCPPQTLLDQRNCTATTAMSHTTPHVTTTTSTAPVTTTHKSPTVTKPTVPSGPWSQWSVCTPGSSMSNRHRLCSTCSTPPSTQTKPCPTTVQATTTPSNVVPTKHGHASVSSNKISAATTRIQPVTSHRDIVTSTLTTRHSNPHIPTVSYRPALGSTPVSKTTGVRIAPVTHRTDNYNLRITVAISSALVGSLLLVAVVACWRRLHLEQMEQRRQLMQPEATQPEYHGLQNTPQSSFPAPPPTYHDAFRLDAQRIQTTPAPSSSLPTAAPSGNHREDNSRMAAEDNTTVDTSGLRQPPPPFVTTVPDSSNVPLTPPPPPPPTPPPNSSTPSTSSNSRSRRLLSSLAARQKSHQAYIVSQVSQGMTADEVLDEDEQEEPTSGDTESLL